LERLMSGGLAAAEIAAIRCRVPPEEAPIICDPWPRKQAPVSGYDAKFSLPYCLALLLVDGRIDVGGFTAEPGGPALALARKISWSPLEGTGFPERFAAEIEIDTLAGETLRARVDDVRGGPARPLARAEVDTKFRSNAGRCLRGEAVETVLAKTRGLEDAANLAALGAALRDLA
ncbi:MAG: MmgE/PrpD family protein, partial [Alphaproteobacteria bacterium]